MRAILAPLGIVIGPVLGTLYYGLIRLINGRRSLTALVGHPPIDAHPVVYLLIVNARLLPAHAITFGNRIYVEGERITETLLDHELVHVEQYHRYGWFGFLARYGSEMIKHGREQNALEVEARDRAPGTH